MKKFIVILLISLVTAFCIKLGTQGREADDSKTQDQQMREAGQPDEGQPLLGAGLMDEDQPPSDAEWSDEDQHIVRTDSKGTALHCLEVGRSGEYQFEDTGREEALSEKRAALSLDSERQDPRGYKLAARVADRNTLAVSSGSLSAAARQERALWLMELKEVQDRREWFLGYKELLERQAGILGTPASIYDSFNEQELERLFRVVQAEIGDEYSFDQKCNVASVIFNRLKHPEFGGILEEVLSPGQFSTVKNGRYLRAEVSQETILACEYSFMIGDTTGGCLFFDSNGVLKYSFVFNDGAHNFYTLPSKRR